MMTVDQAGLTDGEKEVLRLFLSVSNPKVIAQQIGKSPHTVEQRLKSARRRLGVARSVDAAHMLAAFEGNATYQMSVYQRFGHSPPEPNADSASPIEGGNRGPLLPLPTKGRPWNNLSIWMRVIWIGVGITLATAAALLAVSLAEAVGRLAR